MFEMYSLISGSSGNATLLTNGRTHILVDCGASGKRITELIAMAGFDPSNISAILITHEHSDHTKGAGIVSRRFKLPIYATAGTHNAMSIGAIDDSKRVIISPLNSFEIGDIGIIPFNIPHDAAQPCGYSFFCDGIKLSIATDIGHMTNEVIDSIKGSKSVILESNHDIDMLRFGDYPYPLKQRILSDTGHLSNENAAKTALELVQSGTEHIMLGHLSDKNNMPQIALMETYNKLDQNGVRVGTDMTLQVADRYTVTKFNM